MCDAIAHRGPDDCGYAYFTRGGSGGHDGHFCSLVDANFRHENQHLAVLGGDFARAEFERNRFTVGLGHRRLAILDPTPAGHQPMSTPDRRYWVVHNGEVYNFHELREELEAQGHLFQTRTDTEVLLHLWEHSGLDCLPRLNGMFAFAIYDRAENILTVARDRFGIKPLYFAQTAEHFLFGSEIKALLASQALPARINASGLMEYFTFQNVLSDQTLFERVKLLGPGEYLQVDGDGLVRRKTYHRLSPRADLSLTAAEFSERIVDTFQRAVTRQLVSDVEVGSYLSGGMDSGSIVAVAGRSIPRLTTFTGGFDLTNVNGLEQGFDERPNAEKLSYLLQTEHYDVVLHSGDMPAAMERICWHMDDPRVGMCHPVWYVAKLASRFVKVCLAGAGGDELFGGYPWRYVHGLASGSDGDDRVYSYWNRLLDSAERQCLFRREWHALLDEPRSAFDAVMSGAPPPQDQLSPSENQLQRTLYFEFRSFLHGLLITEDHISMAHGLETRVPFLDNELADLAWSIPPSMKVALEGLPEAPDTHARTTEGKKILRRAMEDLLPREFTQMPKQGFSPPDENWYRGPSMDYIREILLDPKCLQRSWFEPAFVRTKLNEHFEGQRNHRLLIWSLLSFEWLQRHFIDQPTPAPDVSRMN